MFLLPGHTATIGDGTLAFSPDGRLLVSGDQEGTVRIWDVAARAERLVLPAHEDWVTGARFIRGGRGARYLQP